jgi:hypothetical protein
MNAPMILATKAYKIKLKLEKYVLYIIKINTDQAYNTKKNNPICNISFLPYFYIPTHKTLVYDNSSILCTVRRFFPLPCPINTALGTTILTYPVFF